MKSLLAISFAMAVPITILAMGQPSYAQKKGPLPTLQKVPVQPVPCCSVTAIDSRTSIGTTKTEAIGRRPGVQVMNPGPTADSRTGLVLAHVNATRQPFVFLVKDPATRPSVRVGQGVYANFPSQQVSLDGQTECCAILALGKANSGSGSAAPAGARQPMAPETATPASAAKPAAGFILSAGAPLGTVCNPAVIVPADWARRVSIPVGATTPGSAYAIISAAQYQASANGPVPVSRVETLMQEGRGGSIDGYYVVDASTSGVHRRPPLAKPGAGGGGRSGSGGPAGSNDPITFLATSHPGDILFASHPGINYDTFGEFNHAAMVITPNWGGGNVSPGEALLAEETAFNPGTDKPGARLVFWSDFVDPSRNYNKVALGRVVGMNEQQRNDVVAWAVSRLGRPYRWPTDYALKDNDNRMYCSQYVWIDYLRDMNIDLDGDGGYIVFPDDIYYDRYVQHIGEVYLPNSGLPF
jgi:Permuted papain-like amidase enzyme, YaeF/YiiX, C92 family